MSSSLDMNEWSKDDFLQFAHHLHRQYTSKRFRNPAGFKLSDKKKALLSVVDDKVKEIARILTTSKRIKSVRPRLVELVKECLIILTVIVFPDDS